MHARRRSLLVALALAQAAVASCTLSKPTATTPKRPGVVATPAAGIGPGTAVAALTVKQIGLPTTLTGKVKIVSDNGGGVISDNGGGIVSDNGGGVISNNSGSVISNDGGSIIANNGSGLTGKVKFGVLAASSAAEFALADAVITLHDASGAELVDEHGAPITATTDAKGTYKLSAVLPAGNLVMRVALHAGGALKGGELSAMLPRSNAPARTRPIDTASSLGAAYVLGKFVKGDQTIYDKLPAAEADSLYADVAGALGRPQDVPSYKPADLVSRTDSLSAKAPVVAHRLEEIRALLLGQTKLGDGRKANTVAIVGPTGLALAPDGSLIVGEQRFGRVRSVDRNGVLSTLADIIRGKVKRNFFGLLDLTSLPDGSVLICNFGSLVKLDPAGNVTTLAGNGTYTPGPLPAMATETSVEPRHVAVGPDGALYIAEGRWHATDGPSRVLALAKDGTLTRLPFNSENLSRTTFPGLAVAADGTVYVLSWNVDKSDKADLLKCVPGGKPTVVASGFQMSGLDDGGLLLGPDGTLYVSEQVNGRITAVSPSGERKVVAGAGGPAGTPELVRPGAMIFNREGTLFVADAGANVVRALGTDGSWSIWAGVDPNGTTRVDLDNIPLNVPGGAAYDENGNLYVSEVGGNSVKRFDGTDIATIAGSIAGFAGDGGPARQALFESPSAIAYHDHNIYVFDAHNFRLRRINAQGVIETLAGSNDGSEEAFAKGERRNASRIVIKGSGLAVDGHGHPYWLSSEGQILRLAADGFVELVAGVGSHIGRNLTTDPTSLVGILNANMGDGGPAVAATLNGAGGLAFNAQGDLYVSDGGTSRVRRITGLDGPAPVMNAFAGAGLAATVASILGGTGAKADTASSVPLLYPSGLAVDASGNVLVGEIGTVAVPLLVATSGTPFGSLADNLPAVYARIHKISPDGRVTLVAGPGTRFFADPTGDDGLVVPAGLAIGPDGRLAIVDAGANLIRILPPGSY